MDKVRMKAEIKDIDWIYLEDAWGIRSARINPETGTIGGGGRLNLPVIKMGFNKNNAINNIWLNSNGTSLIVAFNPNRLFSKPGGNLYQITKNEELKGAIKWIDDVIKEQFKISLKKSDREYHEIHYNIDVPLKEESFKYGKVWNLLADCMNKADVYLKKVDGNRRLINGVGFRLDENSKQVNYDKSLEQNCDSVNIHRFETRWETKNSIKLTFQTCDTGKITISSIKKKVSELFEDNVFSEVENILYEWENTIYKSLIAQRERSRYWIGEWIGEIKGYVFDVEMLRRVLKKAGLKGNALDVAMKRAAETLQSYEDNNLERYKTSYKGNYRRLNEIYKAICGGNKNLI